MRFISNTFVQYQYRVKKRMAVVVIIIYTFSESVLPRVKNSTQRLGVKMQVSCANPTDGSLAAV